MSRFEQHDDELGDREEELRVRAEIEAREAQKAAATSAKRSASQKLAKARKPDEIHKGERATDAQKKLLEGFGLADSLPTKSACKRLIDFILNGNGAGPSNMNKYQRAAYFKTALEDWKGQKAEHYFSGRKGVVVYIVPKRREEVSWQKETRQEYPSPGDYQKISPFEAFVEWEDGGVSYITLGNLKKTEGEKS